MGGGNMGLVPSYLFTMATEAARTDQGQTED